MDSEHTQARNFPPTAPPAEALRDSSAEIPSSRSANYKRRKAIFAPPPTDLAATTSTAPVHDSNIYNSEKQSQELGTERAYYSGDEREDGGLPLFSPKPLSRVSTEVSNSVIQIRFDPAEADDDGEFRDVEVSGHEKHTRPRPPTDSPPPASKRINTGDAGNKLLERNEQLVERLYYAPDLPIESSGSHNTTKFESTAIELLRESGDPYRLTRVVGVKRQDRMAACPLSKDCPEFSFNSQFKSHLESAHQDERSEWEAANVRLQKTISDSLDNMIVPCRVHGCTGGRA
ncbi:hypothetical protein BJ508DRAFT_312401 [Ascobolus immersus RN42]|uniref:Uncharacterized protein n=1 Tax=Ascobolus immersus RN42 TaxID=1160509 RepID=A0A3N4HMC7_ASCIM|nr:hypothetical protein BJ508DRAFT_312401 [Ascobolus immersus RN42]